MTIKANCLSRPATIKGIECFKLHISFEHEVYLCTFVPLIIIFRNNNHRRRCSYYIRPPGRGRKKFSSIYKRH